MFVLPWPGRSVDYTQDDRDAVLEAMNADPQTQGKYLDAFEEDFSIYHGGRMCFGVSSGAAALELSAMLLELKPDDEVIIPAHTYCATAIPFARRGANIRWADITPRIRTVTAENIEPLITDKTKAIVVVHLYGVNVPISCIAKLARDKNIVLIEDCAQSLGASYEYRKSWHGPSHIKYGRSGTHGDIAIYSFHGQKNITTLGEGGMITVENPVYGKHIIGLRHNGHLVTGDKKVVDFDIPGVYPYNFSLGEVQCAIGISQLKRLDYMNACRYSNARRIVDSLDDIEELVFQAIPKGATHTYHLLCARHPCRDNLIRVLAEKYGIQCVIQFAPLYRYPLFSAYREAHCPNTEDFHTHALSFPFAEWYTEEQIDYLIDSIRKAIRSL